ncbi:MAG: hypothetical protein Q7R95_10615 [bacterium]|nr:hypothetical protein [bacterium]
MSEKYGIVEEINNLKFQLEWLWTNCTIIAWPGNDLYYFEHNLAAKKDMRVNIEGLMKNNQNIENT